MGEVVNIGKDTIEKVTEYVNKNYKEYKDKDLIIEEVETCFRIYLHKTGGPLILGKGILN